MVDTVIRVEDNEVVLLKLGAANELLHQLNATDAVLKFDLFVINKVVL